MSILHTLTWIEQLGICTGFMQFCLSDAEYTAWAKNGANAHFCLCLSNALTESNNFLAHISDRCDTNNYIIIFTMVANSAAGWRAVSHCHILSSTCTAKSHLYRACHVASKQFILELGRLCIVGSPAAASILRVYCDNCLKLWNSWNRQWWTNGVRAVWDVHWSQYQWMATTSEMCSPAEWQTYIEHLLNNFSVVGYTRHFCYRLCIFVNCIAL